MLTYLVGTAVLIFDIPVSLLIGACGFFLPRWWHVPLTTVMLALAVETLVASGALEFGEGFAYNWGSALPERFTAILIVMFAGYGLQRLRQRLIRP